MSEWSLYDPLPDGNLCWATSWEDEAKLGWWVQHGDNREARRFFPLVVTHRLSSATIEHMVLDWLQESHKHRPCTPKRLVRPGVIGYA